MKKNEYGFSLLELLVAIAILAILAAVATPYYREWSQNARFREAARGAAATLNATRAQAISHNQAYAVTFDLSNKKYQVSQGGTAVSDWTLLPSGVSLAAGANNTACDKTGVSVVFTFNADGTASAAPVPWLCVQDSTNNQAKYHVGLTSGTTGRIEIDQ